ncbi:uncharacterized protein Dwil_GK28046 [Drosophila willistoni]|nr:uncharacterized protein Dwil_GK28046 [Drosophila willistoni]
MKYFLVLVFTLTLLSGSVLADIPWILDIVGLGRKNTPPVVVQQALPVPQYDPRMSMMPPAMPPFGFSPMMF